MGRSYPPAQFSIDISGIESIITDQDDAASMGRLFDTRWQLTVTRFGILAFKIVIVVILLLAVITPVTGGVKVNLPELNDSAWSYDNGTLRLGTTVSVYNGAMFDVNNFYINLGLNDANSTVLAHSNTNHTNIHAGQWSNLDMRIAIDLNDMNSTALRSLVFNASELDMTVDVGASYPLGWVTMNVGGNHSYDWQPLVKDYGVDVNNMSLAQNGGQYALSVPYHLSVSDWIVGQSLDLKVTMGNSSATLATTDQHIILQQSTNGTMVLNVSGPAAQELISHPEQLHFGAQAGFLNASVTKTYDYSWQPPISGLGIGQPYLFQSPRAMVVPFHFNTTALVTGRSLSLTATMTVNGAASGTGSNTIIAQANNNVNVQIPISTSTLTYLGANPATLAFTVTITSNGLAETQTIQYQWSP